MIIAVHLLIYGIFMQTFFRSPRGLAASRKAAFNLLRDSPLGPRLQLESFKKRDEKEVKVFHETQKHEEKENWIEKS